MVLADERLNCYSQAMLRIFLALLICVLMIASTWAAVSLSPALEDCVVMSWDDAGEGLVKFRIYVRDIRGGYPTTPALQWPPDEPIELGEVCYRLHVPCPGMYAARLTAARPDGSGESFASPEAVFVCLDNRLHVLPRREVVR
jgi:hypothetical protein